MCVTLVDESITWQNLLPLTYTRPISKLRIGILTIQEKWEKYLQTTICSYLTTDYLQAQYPFDNHSTLFINASILPNRQLTAAILNLSENECLAYDDKWIAYKGSNFSNLQRANKLKHNTDITAINRPWHLVQLNAQEIQSDFLLLTKGRVSETIADEYTRIYNPSNVFLELGAQVKAAVLNAENGPIYIGKNAKIHEGAIIRGPFSLCEEGQVAMGAKVREGCTIGVKATGGGELKNSIIGDYSNKGHEGYLGDSIVGSWCNLGALTNVSNLKNTYSHIRVWDRTQTEWVDTNSMKLGCVLGDYVHTGISTMLNTGTIIEPFCMLYGSELHPKFINAFQWGEPNNYQVYDITKAVEVADKIQQAKGMCLSEEEKAILLHIFGANKS